MLWLMFAECSMVSQRNNQAITFCLQFVFYRRRPNRREWPKGGDEGLYGREWDAVRREGSFRPCKCTLWRRSSGLHALSFYSISNLKYSVQKNSALQIFKVFFFSNSCCFQIFDNILCVAGRVFWNHCGWPEGSAPETRGPPGKSHNKYRWDSWAG